jgi:multidrug resistance efflux pump
MQETITLAIDDAETRLKAALEQHAQIEQQAKQLNALGVQSEKNLISIDGELKALRALLVPNGD